MIDNPVVGMLVCDSSYRLGTIESVIDEFKCDVLMEDGVRLPLMPFCYLFTPPDVAASCRARARREISIAKKMEKAFRDHERTVAAELLAAAKESERLLVRYGDPFQGGDWDAVQVVRSAIAKAEAAAST